MTPRDTGAAAKAALVDRFPDIAPRQAMRSILTLANGNVTAAADDLDVGRQSLRAAAASLDLAGWLAERWPNREKGGVPARADTFQEIADEQGVTRQAIHQRKQRRRRAGATEDEARKLATEKRAAGRPRRSVGS